MTDVEQALREELDELTSPVPPPDWDAVLLRASAGRTTPRRRAGVAAVAAASIAVLCVATPLGAAIADGVGGFSSWVTGEPGTPAASSEQQAFDRANARSFHGFPAGTKLRQLDTVRDPASGRTVDLLGFRSGDTLCLRVIVTGATRTGTQACAPLAVLRASGPVRVVLVDQGFGKGSKRAWYGLDHERAPAIRVTVGIAADNVKSVTLRDDRGRHTVPVHGNAFLYVAKSPDVNQYVKAISARTVAGTVAVPFAPALVGFGSLPSGGRLTGPTAVQRRLTGGTIGWLVGHRPVGQPLSVLGARTKSLVERHTVYGRIVAPDPSLPYRVAITLSTSRHGGKATGLCTWQIGPGGGAGGGCAVRADVFAEGPISSGTGSLDGSGEFVTLTGLATDDVAKITAFLANRETQPVALRDNAYIAEVPRDELPVRLVAYDREGRIIGLRAEYFGPRVRVRFASPLPGKPKLIGKVVSATGRSAALYVGPATGGGTCTYIQWRQRPNGGGSEGCSQLGPSKGPPHPVLSLEAMGNPVDVLIGRLPARTASVHLRFSDGTGAAVRPTDARYLIYAVPKRYVAPADRLTEATAVDASGKAIASQAYRLRP